MTHEPLVCPACATPGTGEERFCARCGMPLAPVEAREEPAGERRERARKVQARYTEGELVRVAGAGNQTEAEFLQGLLLEEGVPSVLRRTRGFDVPDFLAAGPRDVLVPRSGWEAARQVLLEAELLPADGTGAAVAPGYVLAGLLAALVVVAGVLWVGLALLG